MEPKFENFDFLRDCQYSFVYPVVIPAQSLPPCRWGAGIQKKSRINLPEHPSHRLLNTLAIYR